ncbi:efflux RND transporter permease subunit, partial [Bradyrhizobium sp.]|uniref:efflux RND transporter permease subunit n=1 Tax=Bradyrhizobium sp. TaxID=376 RepID=UPI0029136B6E
LHADLFRPATFIDSAIQNVLFALLIGGALVIVVLFLFLSDWRTSVISCTAIPLSLFSAVLALQWMGQSLDTMTLGGLAIAIGEVVDDAVIGVENVVRRLRENRALPSPRAAARVVYDAMLEVRSAVAYATFAVLLVFVPILALPGLAGRLFGPLGIAYILAVLASLIVALTVTPALAMMLLAGHKPRGAPREPPLARWSRHYYERLLRRLGRFPKLVMATALLITLGGAGLVPWFGGTFLPDLKEGHLILHVSMLPGTSLDESLRLGTMIAEALRAVPEVRSVAQHAGRAEAGIDTAGTHSSEIEVDFQPGLSGNAQELAERRIRAALANFAGINLSIKSYLTERIEETLSGFNAAVVINVFGPDLDDLETAARDIARELGEVWGAIDIQQQSPPGMPQVNVTLRPTDLQSWGLDAVEVLELIRTAYQGDVVGQAYEGNVVFNVIVKLDPEASARPIQIGDMPIRTPSGAYVLLKQIADVYGTSGRYVVLHRNGQR